MGMLDFLSVTLACNTFGYTVGTWTLTQVGHIWTMDHTVAANISIIRIPIYPAYQASGNKGAKILSVDIWYHISAAAATAVTAGMFKEPQPSDGDAHAAPTAVTFTYDAGHDTAAERAAIAEHKMTLTPVVEWVGSDEMMWVELTVNAPLVCVAKLYDARVNYQIRH